MPSASVPGSIQTTLPSDSDRPGTFSRPLEHALCVLLVAGAVKAPLEVPIYLNATLLVLGLFTVIVLQSLDRLFLWIAAMLALGLVGTARDGVIAASAPRLAQVFVLLFATDLTARLRPELFVRYLVLLLPLMLLSMIVEGLLPEFLYKSRTLLGIHVDRHAGLHGEPNYNAMLYGVVGIMLAQQAPRCLGVLPFLFSIPSMSRGVVVALAGWLGAKLLGRRFARLAWVLVLLLCAQPLIVLAVDWAIDDSTRDLLNRLSSQRYPIWVAYVQMGIGDPLGVGYFRGDLVMKQFDSYLPVNSPPRQAHSIFLQVFGEFGWAGYALFVAFLLRVARIVRRAAPEQLPTLLFVLTGYAFVSGLSDWAFWVPLGYILARTRAAEPPAPLR